LGDLGLAKLVGASTASHTGSGTFGYLPPEAYDEHRLTPTVDLYSLAATYIRLRTGKEPFGTNPVEILTRQQRGNPVLDGVGAAERPLLLAALNPDPAKRFSGDALAWVKELDRAITQPPVARQPDKSTEDVSKKQGLPPTAVSGSSREITPAQVPRRSPVATARLAKGSDSGTLGSRQQTSPGKVFPWRRRRKWLVLGCLAVVVGLFLFVRLRSATEKVAPLDKRAAKALQEACARELGVPATEENTIGMKLVLIPPGEFMMGSPDCDSDAHSHEKPQHKVRITKPFYLGAHEVTVGQFRQFVEATGHKSEAEKDGRGAYGWTGKGWQQDPRFNWRNPGFEQSDEHPVTCVSWNDAVAFCQWLSKKEGKTYRLPTEAEWEYACRAGTTTRWCFGDDEAALGEYAWYYVNSGEKTHPVGQKRPNAWGLYDMHGNVWEWCADWYAEGYYRKAPPDDPTGPSSGADRVLRGGSWINNLCFARSANRSFYLPELRNLNLGFRVARTL